MGGKISRPDLTLLTTPKSTFDTIVTNRSFGIPFVHRPSCLVYVTPVLPISSQSFLSAVW